MFLLFRIVSEEVNTKSMVWEDTKSSFGGTERFKMCIRDSPDIAAVVQKVLDAVIGQFLAPCILHALFVEPIPDLGHGGPLVIPLERLMDKGGGERVKLETLVAVDLIADRQGAAVVLGFQDVYKRQL